jgi:hypothetical protein
MTDAIVGLLVMAAMASGFVGLIIMTSKRASRIREERRRRWAAMGLDERAAGGIALGGAVYGGEAGCGGGPGCGGGACGGGGCGGGGCGGG